MLLCQLFVASGIEPFQVIPTYYPGEEPPQEENVEQKAEAQEEHTSSRMGNTMFVRCLCAYALMPVANECHCCRELEELHQKCNNSGLTYYVIILTSILFEAATSKLRVTKGHLQGLMDENY